MCEVDKDRIEKFEKIHGIVKNSDLKKAIADKIDVLKRKNSYQDRINLIMK